MELRSTFSARLRKVAKSHNTKTAEIAQVLHKHPQTVRNYMNGKTYPTHNTMVKLAQHLNTSVDWLSGQPDVGDKRQIAPKTQEVRLQEPYAKPVEKRAFLIEIEEKYRRTVVVFAENDDAAVEVANDLCESKEIVMTRDFYAGRTVGSVGEFTHKNAGEHDVYMLEER